MKKLLITLPENISQALGYTLLHSLWQGALIVLVCWLVSLGIKQSRYRYNLTLGSLLLLLVTSGLTFFYLYQPARSFELTESALFLTGETQWAEAPASGESFSDSLLGWLNRHIDQVATLWILGVVFLLGRMSLGLIFIEKLKKASLPVVNEKAEKLMQQIRSRVRVSGVVKVAETKGITSPVTVGWLKPVILFPVGMLSGLSVSHLEAILAHELAHIKRSDYLVNILQSFAEVLFFFNPFVWILSSRIRTERENCCDDIALEICGNRLVLAKALVEVADYAIPFAMAFGKKSDSLLTRVKRIVGVSPSGYFNPVNIVGVLFVMSLFFGGVVYAKQELTDEPEAIGEIAANEISAVFQDEKKEIREKRGIAKDSLNSEMEKLQKEIQSLSDEIQKYSEKISGISTKMQATHIKEIEKLSKEISEKAEKIEGPVIEQQKLSIRRMELDLESRKLSLRKDLSSEEKEKLERQLEEQREQLEKKMASSDSRLKEIHNQIAVLQEKISSEQAPISKMQEEISRHSAPIDSLSGIIRVKSEQIRVLAEKQRAAMEKSMNDFIQALAGAGILSGKEDLTLKVKGEELTINGNVRSQADYEKVWELLNRHFGDKEYIDKEYVEARDFSIARNGNKLSWRFRNGRSSYMNNWSSDY